MTLVETLALIALMWLATGSVIALLVGRRWKKQDRRIRTACAFDPVAARGIERGDFRNLKIGGRK